MRPLAGCGQNQRIPFQIRFGTLQQLAAEQAQVGWFAHGVVITFRLIPLCVLIVKTKAREIPTILI